MRPLLPGNLEGKATVSKQPFNTTGSYLAKMFADVTGGADRRKTVRPEVDDTGRAGQYQGIRSCLGDQQRLLTNEVEAR